MYLSSSKWETSDFGGFSQTLYDYPYITVPWEVKSKKEGPVADGLNYYTQTKLMDLFLLKLNEYGLSKELLTGAKMREKESSAWMGSWVTKKRKSLHARDAAKRFCVEALIEKDTELANMFIRFKDDIVACDFSMEVPEEKNEGEGDGGGEGTTPEEDENPTAAQIKAALSLLGDVKKRKPWTSYSFTSDISGDLKKETKFFVMKQLANKCEYTPQEEMFAGNLLRMLDISFDPMEDRVTDLVFGKLDVKKICEVPAGNTHVYYNVQENQITRPFSICILCDESGSMNSNGAKEAQHSTVKVLYRAFSQIMPPSRIYVYGHSGCHKPEIRVYNDKYNQIFETSINRQLSNAYSENYDGPVMECIYEKVRSFTDDNIIFIVLSDGSPAGHNYGGKPAIDNMKRVIEKCKRDGFVTIGVGMKNALVSRIYNYHTVVNDMHKLSSSVSRLVNMVVKTEFQS